MFADSRTLANMSRAAMDAQPYGIVKVNDQGVIEVYNRWEANMAGVESSWAQGRNFFTEVAPCTNNRLIYGRFKKGVESGNLNLSCNYTFTYKMKPTNVKLALVRDSSTGQNFVLVSK
ncbi:MAG: photoactive yellow protein [Myxococcota bacterium]